MHLNRFNIWLYRLSNLLQRCLNRHTTNSKLCSDAFTFNFYVIRYLCEHEDTICTQTHTENSKNTSQVTHVILSNSAVFLSNFSSCAFPSLVNFPCWSLHLHTRFCSRPAALNTCHTNTPTTDPTPPSQPRIHAFIHPSELKNNIQRAQQEERPCWFGGRRL